MTQLNQFSDCLLGTPGGPVCLTHHCLSLVCSQRWGLKLETCLYGWDAELTENKNSWELQLLQYGWNAGFTQSGVKMDKAGECLTVKGLVEMLRCSQLFGIAHTNPNDQDLCK